LLVKVKAPVLFQLLVTAVSHNDHRNTHKQGCHHYPGICMAAAVLLKERNRVNREMCGVQTMLSLVMFNAHVQKKVIVIVQKVSILTNAFTRYLGLQVYTRLNHMVSVYSGAGASTFSTFLPLNEQSMLSRYCAYSFS